MVDGSCEYNDLELIGGDWNHGIWIDFPEAVGNGRFNPTDELHDFSEG